MKTKFLIILGVAIITLLQLNAQTATSARNSESSGIFKNDICLPSKLYMLSGVQNDIFVEPLIKRWRPYNDVVRFSASAKLNRNLERVASVNAPVIDSKITLNLINQDKFDTIKSITSSIIVGQQGVGTDSILVSIIGDSFTNGAFFKNALLTKGYVPKIQLVGLRDVEGYSGQFDEGRGGWTLANYFTISTGRTQSYNGFWQPDGACKYWGSTHFWKLANEIRLSPTNGWTFKEIYYAGRFGTQSLLFNTQTGYKLNPKINDIMYDNNLNSYVKFSGSSWEKVTYTDFTWNFNYGKYLSMWKLKSPLILAEFLGLNDFSNVSTFPAEIDFSKWNSQIKILVSSYLTAVPNGKFVLMIPSSTCGMLDNTNGDFTTRQNACMWELRRNIIENFDKREADGIYIVDAAISIDAINGYNYSTDNGFAKPYSEFTGTEKTAVQTGNPHPYPNYPIMGYSLAAFIQKYRK